MALSRAKALDIRAPEETACNSGYNQRTVFPERAAKTDSGNIREDENAACVVGLEKGRRGRKGERGLGRERKPPPPPSRSHPSPAPRDRLGISEYKGEMNAD